MCVKHISLNYFLGLFDHLLVGTVFGAKVLN